MQVEVKSIRKTEANKVAAGIPVRDVVLVTDVELVFVPTNEFESYEGIITLVTDKGKQYFKPILISDTEKIEVGDLVFNSNGSIKIHNIEDQIEADFVNNINNKDVFKILALPENFNPKHLKMMESGELKEGKYSVECEEVKWATVKKDTKWIYAGHRLKVNRVNLQSNKYRPEDGRELDLSLIGSEFEKSRDYKNTYIYEKDLDLETEKTVIKFEDSKYIVLHSEPAKMYTLDQVKKIAYRSAVYGFNYAKDDSLGLGLFEQHNDFFNRNI